MRSQPAYVQHYRSTRNLRHCADRQAVPAGIAVAEPDINGSRRILRRGCRVRLCHRRIVRPPDGHSDRPTVGTTVAISELVGERVGPVEIGVGA